jgi:hypothetical protein
MLAWMARSNLLNGHASKEVVACIGMIIDCEKTYIYIFISMLSVVIE